MSETEIIRRATEADFDQAMALYGELVGADKVGTGEDGESHWRTVLHHPGTTVYCLEQNGLIVSLTTLHVLPNTTYRGRPYALIENVVTMKRLQGRGLERKLMEHVVNEAWKQDCYKIMLLTGQDVGAKGFYERLGFTADEKHGMTLRRIPVRKG